MLPRESSLLVVAEVPTVPQTTKLDSMMKSGLNPIVRHESKQRLQGLDIRHGLFMFTDEGRPCGVTFLRSE